MKKILIKLIIPVSSLLLAAFLISAIPTESDFEIYGKVVRLHVLANSNSESDQALKLKVRDELLLYVEELTSGCKSREEAEAILKSNLDEIKTEAEKALIKNGSTLSASVSIGKEKYPSREYDGVRLPAGEYCSLRVMLGEAEGKNWWCVLFPSLCRGGATTVEEKLVDVGFTPGQVQIITDSDSPRYKLKFKILEIIGSWFS